MSKAAAQLRNIALRGKQKRKNVFAEFDSHFRQAVLPLASGFVEQDFGLVLGSFVLMRQQSSTKTVFDRESIAASVAPILGKYAEMISNCKSGDAKNAEALSLCSISILLQNLVKLGLDKECLGKKFGDSEYALADQLRRYCKPRIQTADGWSLAKIVDILGQHAEGQSRNGVSTSQEWNDFFVFIVQHINGNAKSMQSKDLSLCAYAVSRRRSDDFHYLLDQNFVNAVNLRWRIQDLSLLADALTRSEISPGTHVSSCMLKVCHLLVLKQLREANPIDVCQLLVAFGRTARRGDQSIISSSSFRKAVTALFEATKRDGHNALVGAWHPDGVVGAISGLKSLGVLFDESVGAPLLRSALSRIHAAPFQFKFSLLAVLYHSILSGLEFAGSVPADEIIRVVGIVSEMLLPIMRKQVESCDSTNDTRSHFELRYVLHCLDGLDMFSDLTPSTEDAVAHHINICTLANLLMRKVFVPNIRDATASDMILFATLLEGKHLSVSNTNSKARASFETYAAPSPGSILVPARHTRCLRDLWLHYETQLDDILSRDMFVRLLQSDGSTMVVLILDRMRRANTLLGVSCPKRILEAIGMDISRANDGQYFNNLSTCSILLDVLTDSNLQGSIAADNRNIAKQVVSDVITLVGAKCITSSASSGLNLQTCASILDNVEKLRSSGLITDHEARQLESESEKRLDSLFSPDISVKWWCYSVGVFAKKLSGRIRVDFLPKHFQLEKLTNEELCELLICSPQMLDLGSSANAIDEISIWLTQSLVPHLNGRFGTNSSQVTSTRLGSMFLEALDLLRERGTISDEILPVEIYMQNLLVEKRYVSSEEFLFGLQSVRNPVARWEQEFERRFSEITVKQATEGLFKCMLWSRRCLGQSNRIVEDDENNAAATNLLPRLLRRWERHYAIPQALLASKLQLMLHEKANARPDTTQFEDFINALPISTVRFCVELLQQQSSSYSESELLHRSSRSDDPPRKENNLHREVQTVIERCYTTGRVISEVGEPHFPYVIDVVCSDRY